MSRPTASYGACGVPSCGGCLSHASSAGGVWLRVLFHTLRETDLALRHIDVRQNALVSDVCLADQAHPRSGLWYLRRHGNDLRPGGPAVYG